MIEEKHRSEAHESIAAETTSGKEARADKLERADAAPGDPPVRARDPRSLTVDWRSLEPASSQAEQDEAAAREQAKPD